jgi:ketosteroid isomerase-like protein
MRYLTLAILALVLLAAPAGAQGPNQEIVAPIQKFIDSFNKGDNAGAAATHASGPDLVIIDEVPPFAWHGAKAFGEWGAALEAASKQAGLTDQKVTIRTPTRIESSGDAAYVIVPAVYTYKEKGTAMRETAQMTFVLKKGASGWLIHAWTWTGPRPQRAGTAGKP